VGSGLLGPVWGDLQIFQNRFLGKLGALAREAGFWPSACAGHHRGELEGGGCRRGRRAPEEVKEAAEGGDDLGWQRHRGRRVPQCGDDMEGGELGKVRLRIWGPE
jgi:hypothetical protein